MHHHPGEDTNQGRTADAAYNAANYGTHWRRSGLFSFGSLWLGGHWWVGDRREECFDFIRRPVDLFQRTLLCQ
jgi:hypothetical protein